MFYEKELNFLRNTFKNCHLQTFVINPNNPVENNIDMGLRKFIGNSFDMHTFYDFFPKVNPCTLYRVIDGFLCRYIFMLLPETEEPSVLIIGPYLLDEITREQIFEQSEKAGFSPKATKQLEMFYTSLPHFHENSPVFSMINSFAELIWHSKSNFSEEDIERGLTSAFSFTNSQDPAHPEDNSWSMQMMENRYNYENELIEAVSLGQTHKAEMLFASFSTTAIENRTPDILRNIKNYCIIMNTLLRKAAENGGVHPIYLDNVSSDFAKGIEQLTQMSKVEDFMKEMLRTYCRLVKNHSTKKYSTPVQRAIIKIDSDLTQDLTLKTLSVFNNISPGYFSGLFKAETGQTLTDFVNSRRIETAKRLLKNTTLQIQTISQHCGILDVNYFTKLFRKYTGKTPRAYREKKWTVS